MWAIVDLQCIVSFRIPSSLKIVKRVVFSQDMFIILLKVFFAEAESSMIIFKSW